jgi:hypothetical protein
MRYKRTVARIGLQLLLWFRVEWKVSIEADGILDPSIALTARRMGTWAEDEDIKLKGAVQTLSGKNWGYYCSAGFGSNARTVSAKVARCLGSQHQPDECTYG